MRTHDNRDLSDMEHYYLARIETLEIRIKNLEGQLKDLTEAAFLTIREMIDE